MDSSTACPLCGRALDPLHAGHVAFVGGRFLYFCDRDHKTQWLTSQSGPASDAIATAEPPAVATRTNEYESDTSASTERDDEPAPAFSDEEPRSMPIRRWAASDEAPNSIRVDPAPRVRPESTPLGVTIVAYAGAVAGALAIGVALLGASGDVARLPLAVVAGTCAITYGSIISRRLLARAPWLGAFAVVAACTCALAMRALGVATAPACASFAGVASVAFIVVCATMLRAAEPVANARAAIVRALDVPARTGANIISAADVRAGEQVVINEGETIAVDGVVVAGEAVVSPWLEAETDVTKGEGAPVVAGARVLSGTLRVTATWTGAERAFAKFLNTRTDAFESAPLVQLATLLEGRVLAPLALVVAGVAYANGASVIESIVCAAAALTAFAPPSASFAVALLHARGHLRALQLGVVHRDARHFDRAGRAQIAVVCARGTVLLGEPEIVAIEAVGSGGAGDAVIALASAVATGSPHPFAAAILRAARARSVRPENVRNPVHSGSGATAIDTQGERIVLGRRAFLLAERVSVAVADEVVRDHESQGRSVLLAARAGKVVGIVALQDGLRAGARAAVQKLHDARIEPVLLSGEARETCEAIGRALDVEHLRPEVAGVDRGAEVRALAEGGDVVAVLGHPAADDSALGAADVSVALDAAGASPGEWSVVLASDDVRSAAEALTIPRAARERSVRAMAIALAPGLLASFALAFQLMPAWTAPLVGALAASIALLVAKE